ncbi:FAD binding domain-containing protein [Actinokineospora inagensis]|uniref:FAD binding domain-containing protein n=1 Tax=Actinokineospora inagensis TaxID=103730 RepID=UPI00040C7E12|nr:FAD binding domain-containing protein [Actinokineospora inagensis]
MPADTGFDYVRAADTAHALTLLDTPGAKPIAGGTDLVTLLRSGVDRTPLLVDLAALRGQAVRVEPRPPLGGPGIVLDALARMADVAADGWVRATYPVIAQALELSASPQVRNLGTVAGNLAQRTRCPYFRAEAPTPCAKRSPGSGCAARRGVQRGTAVFTADPDCVATHPSDLAVALAALDAEVLVESRAGERTIPVTEFYRPDAETVLRQGDLVTAVAVPPVAAGSRSAYLKVRERASFEFALVSCAAEVVLDGCVIRSARLAVGGVAGHPWRLTEAESALVGLELGAPAVRSAIDTAFAAADPLPGAVFKVELAARAAVRALRAAGSHR